MSPRCFACQGPYHPATGHAFSEDVLYCGRCIRHFYQWVRGHTRNKWGGYFFYEEARTSVRAGVWPVEDVPPEEGHVGDCRDYGYGLPCWCGRPGIRSDGARP